MDVESAESLAFLLEQAIGIKVKLSVGLTGTSALKLERIPRGYYARWSGSITFLSNETAFLKY